MCKHRWLIFTLLLGAVSGTCLGMNSRIPTRKKIDFSEVDGNALLIKFLTEKNLSVKGKQDLKKQLEKISGIKELLKSSTVELYTYLLRCMRTDYETLSAHCVGLEEENRALAKKLNNMSGVGELLKQASEQVWQQLFYEILDKYSGLNVKYKEFAEKISKKSDKKDECEDRNISKKSVLSDHDTLKYQHKSLSEKYEDLLFRYNSQGKRCDKLLNVIDKLLEEKSGGNSAKDKKLLEKSNV